VQPICNPFRAALQAVCNPPTTKSPKQQRTEPDQAHISGVSLLNTTFAEREPGTNPGAATPNNRARVRTLLAWPARLYSGPFACVRSYSPVFAFIALTGRYLNHETAEVITRLHRTL
jgi:hypothetical protein